MVHRLDGLKARRPAAVVGRRRHVGLALLAVAVAAVHGCVTQGLAERLRALGDTAAPMPARIEVAYVRDLALATPPAVVLPPAPVAAPAPAPVARARAPAKAASAPEKAPRRARPASAPEPAPDAVERVIAEPAPEPASAPLLAAASSDAEPVPAATPGTSDTSVTLVTPDTPEAALAAAEPASAASAAAVAAAGPEAAASSGGARFEWPASTRISYVLTGNYRGEVQGEAKVEWVRVGSRYQVHLDIAIGPGFAPMITRRMTSDGQITAAGLAPQRYDQDTEVVFRDRRRATLLFEPESVVLANGERRPSVAGLQDTASQFVQLTYLFSTRPELLRVGNSVEVPLALPHKIDRWTYDVLGEQVLHTPFGPVPAFHLKPRREVPKPGELNAEIWFAPQLRYLPLRIRIQQDAATFVDLMIARRPQLAAE